MPLSATIFEADILAELTQELFSQPDVNALLRRAKDYSGRLVHADRTSIFVLARDRKELWSVVADGEEMIRVPEGKGIIGEVMRSGVALNVADAAHDERFYSHIDNQTGYETRSILCVPLRGRHGKALGAIEALNRKDGGPFTSRDERILSLLGIQTGLAVEHIEMREDTANHCVQLRLLLDIQKNINDSMDTAQILEVTLAQLMQAICGICGVIQTVTRNGIIGYHGYHPEKGYRYWEEVDRRSWPRYFSKLRWGIENIPESDMKAGFHRSESLVYARLGHASENRGYIAVELQESRMRLYNPAPLDSVKVIAEQTVSLIDKQEAAQEKQRAEKQALLGNMLSTVVHDIKNPLSGITGFAQLIKRRTADGKIHEFCDIILDSLTRLERMNSELLLFVRGESLDLDRSVFLLDEFLRSLANALSPACQQCNITIDCECPAGLKIYADKDRLYRVFTNLLSNAREAIGKDGSIRIVVMENEDSLMISVTDTGRGIPGRILEHIFEPFVSYGKAQGTGLGMSIAKSIIEKHEGTIQVKSILGKGTTVTIMLPGAIKATENNDIAQ